MGVMGISRKLLEKVIDISYSVGLEYGEMKKIKDNRRQKLVNSVRLTNDQKERIDTLFKTNYGKKMPYDWHRLYQSFTGKFQEKYFPEILFSTKFEPMVNPRAYRYVLDDKILLSLFCCGEKNVRIPETVGTYCNGVYFDANHRTMSLEQLSSSISNMGRLLIKPTQDTSSGRGVRIISAGGGTMN